MDDRTTTSRPQLRPPQLRQHWFDARRQVLLRRLVIRALLIAVVVGAVWVTQNWWLLRAYVIGTDRALAEACRDSPYVTASVTAAGGPDAIDRADHPALAPYRDDRDGRQTTALSIRDHASLAGDEDLASAAAAASFLGPFPGAAEISRVEVACAAWMERTGIGP